MVSGPAEQQPVAARRYRLDSRDSVLQLFGKLRHSAIEIAAFAYLDPEWMLLGLRHTTCGTSGAVSVPARLVVTDAIAFGAAAVVMAHNHPSGDPRPSMADRHVTRRIAHALGLVDITLVDHLVLARHGDTSFRAQGLL